MAGGSNFGPKSGPQNKHFSNGGFTSEVLKNSQEFQPAAQSQPPQKFSLKGILGLGQIVEIGKQANNLNSWGKELFGSINHLDCEQKSLYDSRQKELEKTIQNLQKEIKNLTKATKGLEKDVEKVAITPINEINKYQLSFLDRIRLFLSNLSRDVSNAGLWLESFSNKKKKKKNYFWNTVKNKKGGGEQYLFSNEHSMARSAT